MVDTKKHIEWFEIAGKDLKAAEILFANDADNGMVCFHCQQAIEKYIKGFLIFKTGGLQDGHNLVKLCKKASVYHKAFIDLIKDLAYVNTYYIETRYPAEEPLPVSKEDANECIYVVKKVIQKVDEAIAVSKN